MGETSHYKIIYVLWEKMKGWKLKGDLKFNTFEALKTYLIENTNKLFGWINNHVEKYNDYQELPNFNDVETVGDINKILDDYNYLWWFLKVDIVEVEYENEI